MLRISTLINWDEGEVYGEVLDIWELWHLNGVRAVTMIMTEEWADFY